MPERARIATDDISTHDVVAIAEPDRTLRDPTTLADAPHESYFTRWAPNHPINLVWDQLELVVGQQVL